MSEYEPYNPYQCNSSEIKETFFAGYETQVEAGCGVICQVGYDLRLEIQDSDYKILIFGMPGTGKSLYPKP